MKNVKAYESNDGTLHKTLDGAERWERTCSINSVRHNLKQSIYKLKIQKNIIKNIILLGKTGHNIQQSNIYKYKKECSRLDILLKTVKLEYKKLKQ